MKSRAVSLENGHDKALNALYDVTAVITFQTMPVDCTQCKFQSNCIATHCLIGQFVMTISNRQSIK